MPRFALTQRQQRAIVSLDWLLDPTDAHRRTGRSTAFAFAILRVALRNPGTWVPVLDHYFSHGMMEYVLDSIMDIGRRVGLPEETIFRRGRPPRIEISIRNGFQVPLSTLQAFTEFETLPDELGSVAHISRPPGPPPEPRYDALHEIMLDAVAAFGGEEDGMFNAAGFGLALQRRAGVIEGGMDAYLVTTILAGRADVESLGGGYYRVKPWPTQALRVPEVIENPLSLWDHLADEP